MASPDFTESAEPLAEPPAEPQAKRRKVRKGTHTCWECKRRKVRCVFASDGDATCIGCAKRCLRCVSQEFPEETTTPAAKSRLVGDRIVRMEEMIRQLADKAAGGAAAGGGSSGRASTGRTHTPGPGPPLRGSSADAAPSACVPSGMVTPAPSDTPASSAAASVSGCGEAPPPPVRRGGGSGSSSADADAAPGVATMLPGVSHETLSAALLSVFPSARDMEHIADHTTQSYNHVQLAFRSHRDVRDRGFWPPQGLCVRHGPQTHPVLIARRMLVIAVVLQGSDPATYRHLAVLSEPVRDITTRLARTAISLVTRNDELLDNTLEGVECLMLEGLYHANGGQLRRSWLTWRRALSLAQLMRIPRQSASQKNAAATHFRGAASSSSPSPFSSSSSSSFSSLLHPFHLDPQFLWYRLLSTERFMCLLLGLPQTTIHAPLPPPDVLGNDTPLGQLEHKLATITSFILDRNERGPRPDDYANTLKIDKEMQDIAAALPSRWWLPPNLSSVPAGETSLWETMRLTYQSFYYNLLHQLHLPYMLHPSSSVSAASSSTDTPSSSQSTTTSSSSASTTAPTSTTSPSSEDDIVQQRNREYSRIVSVGASREVLSRYIALRSHNHVAGCCRYAEFFALTAGLTLILVHIDGHRNRHNAPTAAGGHPGIGAAASLAMPANLLAHQRLSDRAMTEEVLESMKIVGKLNEDAISETSVDLLRQLLDIEAEAARSGAIGAIGTSTGEGGGEGRRRRRGRGTARGMRISVPYVGYITIARNGAITKEAHLQPPAHARNKFSSLPYPDETTPEVVRSTADDDDDDDDDDDLDKTPDSITTSVANTNINMNTNTLTRPTSPTSTCAPQPQPQEQEPSFPTAHSTLDQGIRTAYDVALLPRMEQFISFAGLMGQDLSSAPRDQHMATTDNSNGHGHDHNALPVQHPSGPASPTPGGMLSLIPNNMDDAAAAGACPGADCVPLPTQPMYPTPAAGSDQWAFQGVDMAFFDNLMRETTMDPGREGNKSWL